MKAYKGFLKTNDGRLYCQPSGSSNIFYYEEGNTYTLPEGDKPELCRCGFHACTNPTDVFSYYSSNMGNVEFHEVELEGVTDERGRDSKVAGSKITIGRKLTEDEMVDIGIKMMLDNKEDYFDEEGWAIVRKDNKQNLVNTEGKLVSDSWFASCANFKYGFARVIIYNGERSPEYNFINSEGKYLLDKWCHWCEDFSEGLAAVCERGKYNYIRMDGTLLSDTWFDNASSYYKGTAKVKINGKWVAIDTEGKIIEQ